MIRLLLAAVLIAALATLAWAARGRLTQDLAALLPEDDPRLARQLAFFAGQADTRILAVEAVGDDGHALLLTLPPRLAPYGAHPLVSDDPTGVLRAAGVVLTHLPELTPVEDLPALRKRLEPNALVASLRALKERVSRPEDQATAAAARIDPLGLAGAALSPMAPTGRQVGALRLHADGEHWLLLLAVDFPPEDLGRTTALLDALADPKLTVVGAYRHYRENLDTVHRDLLASLPVCAVLIVAVLYALLRSWRGVLLVYVPAVLGMVGALASGAAWSFLTGRALPLPLLGFAAGLLGIAVDYGTYVCCACRSGELPAIRKPLVMSYLAAAVAFSMLWASPVPGLRLLGVLVVGGLGTSLLASLLLLPQFCRGLPGRDPWAGFSASLLGWTSRLPRRNLLAAALLTLLLAPGLLRLAPESDLRRLDGSNPGTWAALATVLGRWGGFDTSVALVADAPERDAALHGHAQARLALGLPVPLVERLVPDAAEQTRRRTAWNATVIGLPERFAAACAVAGLRAGAFDLSAYAAIGERPPLTLESWAGTPVTSLLASQVRKKNQVWQVATPVNGQAVDLEARLPADSGAWIAARTAIGTGLVSAVRGDLAARIPLIIVAILILVAVVERDVRRTLAILLPPALALTWSFGLLGWLGQPLTPLSLLAAAFIGGIGINSALFLGARHHPSGLSPVLAANASAIIGTAALASAAHPLVHGIGLALTIGLSMSLIACLLVTPALLARK